MIHALSDDDCEGMTRRVAALFGATGRTGSRVLERAMAKGWQCRVLVRDKSKLADHAVPAAIVEGDVRSADDVAATLEGAEAVFCCLGLPDISRPTTDFSDGVRTIINGMQARNIRRIVAIASAGVLDHPGGGYRNKEGLPATFRHIAAEHERNYESLRDSGLEWTLMCPVTLVEDIPAGHALYAFDDLPGGSGETGYDDLAATMVDLVDRPESFGKRVGIVSQRQGKS